MFLIIGISPKTKIIDQNARRCPVCGLRQAYNRRIDHFIEKTKFITLKNTHAIE